MEITTYPVITNTDLTLANQHSKKIYIKIQFLDSKFKPINDISGSVITGNISNTTSSLVRRSAGLTILLNKETAFLLKDKFTWFKNYIRIYCGIYSNRLKEIVYYNIGTYISNELNTTLNLSTNELTLNCIDLMGDLQETHHGSLFGTKNQTIYAGVNIRQTLIDFIKQFTNITDYYIEEIGTYYDAFAEGNNTVPYDLELSESSVISIIQTLVELYPYYETYIDENGVFICKKLVSNENEPVLLSNELMKQYMINETVSYPVTDICNVVEVWGETVDYDRYTDNVTFSKNTYNVTYDDIDALGNGTLYAFKTPMNITNSSSTVLININGLGTYKATHPDKIDNNYRVIETGYLKPETVYVFKYSRNQFYLQGQFQVHGIAMLLSSEPDMQMKNYYRNKFNCDNMYFAVEPDNPFSVELCGIKAVTKKDGEFDNITSDYLAYERAKYELYKCKKTNEVITLEMTYLPFLPVNVKVEYQPLGADKPYQYLVTDIKANIENGIISTMNVTMTRFYNLFENM